MTIINEDGEKTTPKQVAKRIARIQLNMACVDDEIARFERMTQREKELIYDQYWKLVERIDNRYIS